MRSVPRRSSLALLVAVAAAFAAPSVATAAEGDIIVRYASGADPQERAEARADADVVARGALPLAHTEVVAPERGTTVTEAVADLERSPDVAYAEPDQPRSAFDLYPDEARLERPFANLWALHNTGQVVRGSAGVAGADIGTPAAWGVTTGSASVKVAVVDSGVDRTHPDLFANLTPGYDFAYGDSDPTDYDGHGTHVAGIIAARGNNGTGVTGVAWETSLIPVQALDAAGEGSTSDIVAAYTYAVGKGARIVNASFGGPDFSRSEYDAIRAASNVLFVAAAGNTGTSDDTTPSYPCAYDLPNVLCVAATDNTDHLAGFSNFGPTSVDIAAPGVQIYSTYRCDTYDWLSGTSMAAPEVSGAAALVLAKFPALSATALRARLLSTADPLNATDAPKIAGGRLDVAKAVGAAITTTTPPPSTTNSGDGGATAPAMVFAAPRVGEPAPPTPACPAAPVRTGSGTVDPIPATPTDPPLPTTPSVPSTPRPTVDPPRTTAPAVDRTAPAVAATLAGRGALKLLLAGKLRVTTTAGERASLRVDLRLDARTAKRLHLTTRSGAVTIATGTASLTAAGTAKARVRLTSKAKRALARVRSLKVTLRATATDAAGNARTRSRSVTITR